MALLRLFNIKRRRQDLVSSSSFNAARFGHLKNLLVPPQSAHLSTADAQEVWNKTKVKKQVELRRAPSPSVECVHVGLGSEGARSVVLCSRHALNNNSLTTPQTYSIAVQQQNSRTAPNIIMPSIIPKYNKLWHFTVPVPVPVSAEDSRGRKERKKQFKILNGSIKRIYQQQEEQKGISLDFFSSTFLPQRTKQWQWQHRNGN